MLFSAPRREYAIADPSAPRTLREEITELGWSAEQLMSRVNQVRARRGLRPMHPKSAYPWLRGRRPSPDPLTAILVVLRERDRPATAADLGWDGPRPQRCRRALNAPWKAGLDELLDEITEFDLMKRRSLLLLSGMAVTASALDLLDGPASSLITPAAGGPWVSPHLADHIDDTIRQMRDLDDTEGSGAAVQWTSGLWRSLATILTRSRYDRRTGQRLHVSYLELSELYGWMLFDSAAHPQAQRVYQSGLLLTREVDGHPALDRATANLLASAGHQESWLGHHDEAATLLDVAARRTPHALTPRLRAVLADRALSAAGRQADPDRLRRAADHAHEHLLDTSAEDPWWSQWLTHPGVDACTGSASMPLP